MIGSIAMLNNKNNAAATQTNQIVLYYGEGCPHCAKVEEFIKENKIEEKVQFARKEVWYNQINAAELGEKAKICGLKTDTVGVPFLWDGSKCLIGDQDIINFFKTKADIQNAQQ